MAIHLSDSSGVLPSDLSVCSRNTFKFVQHEKNTVLSPDLLSAGQCCMFEQKGTVLAVCHHVL